MKVLLNIVAVAFIIAGLLVAVVSIVVPGQVILGIDVRLAATLLTGGFVLLALGKALELLEVMSRELRRLTTTEAEPPWLKESAAAAAPAPPAAAPASAEPARRRAGEPPREAVEPRWHRAAGSPTPSAREHEAPTPPLATATPMPEPEPEPIPQANQRLEPAPTLEPAEPEVPKNADTPQGVEASELKPSEDSADEKGPPELYVVEERRFRGKQARVLSDGTIEAETEEGWMRFEDMEHLREYLDATIGPRR
jgi:outer membrane biosynthesis protein TonB